MKVLMCGLGSIGQRHVRNLRTLLGDQVEILAYRNRASSPVLNADMTVKSGADLESTYQIRSFTNLDDALNEKPDAVFITNPNTLHVPVALAAARSGCQLFIEKPISHNLDQLDELLCLVETFVAYQFRFHPGLRWVRSKMDEGRLGHIISAHIVNGEYLPGWHPYEDYRESYAARAELGGGSLRVQTHEIDYALWLFGMPRQVFAMGGHLSNLEMDVEDSVNMLLRCEYRGTPLPVHIHLDYLQKPPQRICEVIGDAGKLRYDYYANEVVLHELGAPAPLRYSFQDFDRNQMFMDELQHFLACVRGEAQSMIDLREGIRSMKIGLAADQSLKSGQIVDL